MVCVANPEAVKMGPIESELRAWRPGVYLSSLSRALIKDVWFDMRRRNHLEILGYQYWICEWPTFLETVSEAVEAASTFGE